MSEELKQQASELKNLVVIDYQPIERLSEVLATADLHLVSLKSCRGRTRVASKIYLIF